MLFDVQTALAEILNERLPAAKVANPAIGTWEITPFSHVSQNSQSAPAESDQQARTAPLGVPSPAACDDDTYRHGRTFSGEARTWTGRIVSLDQWRELSEWERHGPNGRLWNGVTKRWEGSE